MKRKIKFKIEEVNLMKFENKKEEKKYYETVASEEEFLKWYKAQDLPKYETPSVTVDNVMFCYNREEDQLKMLLIKRKAHPFKDSWALPGGFVNPTESTNESCLRETQEETGVKLTELNIEQLYTFSTPNRDPRGWAITTSYIAFLNQEVLTAGDYASDVKWFNIDIEGDLVMLTEGDIVIQLDIQKEATLVSSQERLAFDHGEIISTAFKRIRGKMYSQPRVLTILGESFTITEARKVFAKFLGLDYKKIDHSNFKKDLLKFVKEVDERPTGVGRPSKFYAVDSPYLT